MQLQCKLEKHDENGNLMYKIDWLEVVHAKKGKMIGDFVVAEVYRNISRRYEEQSGKVYFDWVALK